MRVFARKHSSRIASLIAVICLSCLIYGGNRAGRQPGTQKPPRWTPLHRSGNWSGRMSSTRRDCPIRTNGATRKDTSVTENCSTTRRPGRRTPASRPACLSSRRERTISKVTRSLRRACTPATRHHGATTGSRSAPSCRPAGACGRRSGCSASIPGNAATAASQTCCLSAPPFAQDALEATQDSVARQLHRGRRRGTQLLQRRRILLRAGRRQVREHTRNLLPQ